jgi:hypothetical protein
MLLLLLLLLMLLLLVDKGAALQYGVACITPTVE